ncbi:hypothetical protein ACFSTE_13240 [Aquimarina hainanensis]|uniref:Four helix bundle protein n=1 Tax=Aquimarina hainanensis TaxID=1578017 RepID=A0ABW5NBJ4_9FLAO
MHTLEILLKEAQQQSEKIQNKNRTREMSLVITKIEEAQLWLMRLRHEDLKKQLS